MVSLCIAGFGIVGFFLVMYFAHCFLTVLIDSAAGQDEIRWPQESISDWLAKPIYVLWVLTPLLSVAIIVLTATGDARHFGITLLVLLWLVAPILFLSSLAAKSWMAFLYGPFLRRWARFLFAYVIFLIWSAVLVGLGAAMLVWSMLRLEGVAVAAVFLPALCLLYWRIFGRYAWYVTTRRMRKPKKKMVNPAKGLKIERSDPWAQSEGEPTEVNREHSGSVDNTESAERTAVTDLRDKFTPVHERDQLASAAERDKVAAAEHLELLPLVEEQTVVEEDEWTPNKKPYGVMTETDAKQSWIERRGTAGQDDESYDVENLSIGPPVSLFQYYVDREKKEEELREQGKSVRQFVRPRKPPTLWQALTKEIVGFLIYPHTLRAWVNLGILFAVALLLLNVIVSVTNSLGV